MQHNKTIIQLFGWPPVGITNTKMINILLALMDGTGLYVYMHLKFLPLVKPSKIKFKVTCFLLASDISASHDLIGQLFMVAIEVTLSKIASSGLLQLNNILFKPPHTPTHTLNRTIIGYDHIPY